MRWLIAFALSMMSGLAAASEAPKQIDWAALIDHTKQQFEDPYRDLDPEKLRELVEIARMRAELEKAAPESEARASLETTLSQAEAKLTAEGIDIDHLIAQRWVVAERRREAAHAGNPELTRADVRISGFVIPAPPDADGRPVAYLVPERGMCSHMPPPPPNQMIRVRMTDGWTPSFIYEPVTLTGEITIAPNVEMVMVVDGLVPMSVTYQLDAVASETITKLARGLGLGTRTPVHGTGLPRTRAFD
ncbi:MAG: DUF3299 domain-containing protein [Pseudomonadota bacterium]